MSPIINVFDNFFPTEHMFRRIELYGAFETITNPVDGQTYEGIATNIEDRQRDFLTRTIPHLIGHVHQDGRPKPIDVNFMFARLMTNDTPPSKIHSDLMMGEFSLHVYMSRQYPNGAGTQFWRHQKFGDRLPSSVNHEFADEFVKSCERPPAWHRTQFVPARFNRALLHDSSLWHSAEPHDGFGATSVSGRIVLTTFFSRKWE